MTAAAPALRKPAPKLSTRLRAVVCDGAASSGFRVARGVAEVVEDDHRVRGEVERGDVRLAVILVVRVAVAGGRVEPEPVLRRVLRVVRVRAGPAVPMPQVDDDAGADDGGLDLGPRRVGAVDLDDVGGVLDRLGVRLIGGRRGTSSSSLRSVPTMITTLGSSAAFAGAGWSRPTPDRTARLRNRTATRNGDLRCGGQTDRLDGTQPSPALAGRAIHGWSQGCWSQYVLPAGTGRPFVPSRSGTTVT